MRRRASKKNKEIVLLPLIGAKQKKTFKTLAVVVALMSATIYINHRLVWIGKENANLAAKEYFVAGQTLNSYKAILTTFLHPELPIIVPLTKLQWKIYEKGVALLPKNEGEAGVWQNMWFHHHFGKKDRPYFGVKRNRPSPKMVKILDQYWFCLEAMTTKPFADKKMEEKYLEGFAGLAFSYTLKDGYYSGKYLGSAKKMAKLPEMVHRYRLLVQWLNELRAKWKDSASIAQTVQNNPKMEVLSQLTLLINLSDIILGEIHSHNFDCDLSSIHQYIKMRKEFYSPDNGSPVYKKIRNHKEREAIYHIAVNAVGARNTKYLIEHYCGYEVAGKMDMSFAIAFAKDKNITLEQQEELWRRASLREEIKIIEGESDVRK
ncbi:uncharacterized protein TOL2_C26530 [Desulfobacula toluolica Tol2]|uniref:Uncharacterized protein n=2 Tax=Desulfobacula toluolica TaxID=28223 RepID=K0NPL8_DESTT|nr:uncharacterized protein TOL2_C26530 [Desulfobacula toluolica Tol2]